MVSKRVLAYSLDGVFIAGGWWWPDRDVWDVVGRVWNHKGPTDGFRRIGRYSNAEALLGALWSELYWVDGGKAYYEDGMFEEMVLEVDEDGEHESYALDLLPGNR